ncbi:MAG: trigger factor [Bacteroidetes bacterium]|nr:trigger factor [Bacteroidota bacterium]MBS1607644.1 trigger factor [Bacteroidota bacterium]
MATITKENIGLLHERLTVKLEKTDYLPSFEKALKDYSKKANIPGFRKGQVPAGLIKKMYGTSVFSDEVLRSVDRELIKYLETDKLDIFAQPLPMEIDMHQLDMNNPADYVFHFEVGMKPEFDLADLSKAKTIRYKVTVTDEMINNEIERLQNRYGNMKDLDKVDTEENVLNVLFTQADENGNDIEGGIKKDNSLLVKYFKESFRRNLIGKTINDFIIVNLEDAFEEKEREWIISDLGLNKDDETAKSGYFKIQITKIGLLEKKELNEEFFNQLYPNQEVKTEADFRNKIKEQIQTYWDNQAKNQIHDQAYHELVDHTKIQFPEGFLKKWMRTQGEQVKSDEEVENEFPVFINQLKWTLITDKIVRENNISVQPEELKTFAKQQLFGYMGMSAETEEQGWVNDYIDKMMKDRKYVEDAYSRLQTQKIFEWAETQVKPEEKEISAEEFTKMVEEHQQHHHH